MIADIMYVGFCGMCLASIAERPVAMSRYVLESHGNG